MKSAKELLYELYNAITDTENHVEHVRSLLINHPFLIEIIRTDSEGLFRDQSEVRLHLAVGIGNREIVESLLSQPEFNVNFPAESGTLLHLAVVNGHTEVVKLLVHRPAINLNFIDVLVGYTPLQVAVRNGRPDIVKLLLEAGAKVNLGDDEGNTPLHLAVGRGYGDIVKLLLQSRAEVNSLNDQGNTPLHYAITIIRKSLLLNDPEGNIDDIKQNRIIIILLLKGGATLNQRNTAGKTPLDLAEDLSHVAAFGETLNVLRNSLAIYHKGQAMYSIWVMEKPEHDGYLEWLPAEMVEDVHALLLESGLEESSGRTVGGTVPGV